jgi:enoyl-CoA hydratase
MDVSVDVDGTLAVLTLRANARRNALTAAMARELAAALATIEADERIAALVLTGGDYFCAGGHRDSLAAAGEDPAASEAFWDMDAIYQVFIQLGELSVPSIAAVRGGAVGAGLNLALAADVRIVARDAVLQSGFLRIGAHPGGGHFGLIDSVCGPELAAAMTLLDEAIDGERAARIGLALAAVEDERVEDRARELARAARDPELVRVATRSLRQQRAGRGVPWRVALRAEQAVQMWSLRRSSTRARPSGQGAAPDSDR